MRLKKLERRDALRFPALRGLRRFYRLEASRSTPGNGLGLSLVQAVVGLHEGRLGFGDNGPGLVVTLYF